MARNAAQDVSIDRILRATADEVVARVSTAISQTVGRLVEERLKKELAGSAMAGRRGRTRVAQSTPSTRSTRARQRVDITRWVADARARRVPKFVIEATGLDTKKKIVAKFGAGVTFEKGKPVPKTRAS
jgi:hypothetical protein